MTLPKLQRNDEPKFCIITPTEYCNEYASQSEMHLVLAHLVDVDDKYADFYRDRTEFKIMDNGAFELGASYEPDKLIELGKKCKADAIVLPDYPFQEAEVTIEAACKWGPSITKAGFYTMFVPQSKRGDLEDWLKAYKWAAQPWGETRIDIVGMSILAIPNALPHIPKSYARVVMTEILRREGLFADDIYHHYLGLNSGPNLEIPPLIETGSLDSCDSSNPVWMGMLGHMYTTNSDSFLPVSKVHLPVDFKHAYVHDKQTHRRIQTNIDMTLSLFNTGESQ